MTVCMATKHWLSILYMG